ncbi:hypothetical protein TSH20_28995 [Azospirillum sp. TSH20]|nr:hypothetical protein TSH20_28995 [Azospirillum sp. TSH20]
MVPFEMNRSLYTLLKLSPIQRMLDIEANTPLLSLTCTKIGKLHIFLLRYLIMIALSLSRYQARSMTL